MKSCESSYKMYNFKITLAKCLYQGGGLHIGVHFNILVSNGTDNIMDDVSLSEKYTL